MKKFLILCIFFSTPCYAATDFTLDANCQFFAYMNGNNTSETDVCQGNTLSESGGSMPTSADVPSGYTGTSRDFESADTEFLTHADSLSTDISGANQNISLGAWIKAESLPGGQNEVISKYLSTGDQRQYKFVVTSAGAVACALSSDGTSPNTTEATTADSVISTGTWYHIACVYNDTDIRIYVDGSLTGTPASHTAGIFNGSEAFGVGSRNVTTGFWDGLIDEPFVMDRELSSSEVSEIMTDGFDGSFASGARRIIKVD